MGLSYTPGKGWNVSYANDKYREDYDTNRPIAYEKKESEWEQYFYDDEDYDRRSALRKTVQIFEKRPDGSSKEVFSETFESPGRLDDRGRPIIYSERNQDRFDKFRGRATSQLEKYKGVNDSKIKENKKWNKEYADLNASNQALNTKNRNLNNAYNTVINIANGTRGNDYLNQRALIDKIGNIDNATRDSLKQNFKTFYKTEKITTWDASQTKPPPYGKFDAKWYLQQYPDIQNAWNDAVRQDNLDVTARFTNSPTTWAAYHYTNFGSKPSEKRRGNPAEKDLVTQSYLEKKLTDKQLQDLRDKTLGISDDIGASMANYVESTPEIAAVWNQAKGGDEYWQNLAKNMYLDLDDPNDFYYAFSTSERPEDVALREKLRSEGSLYVSDIEEAILEAAGNKSLTEVKKFGALVQNVLDDTVQEIKEQKLKEQNLNLYRGLPGFEEIFGASSTLTESILGDSGIGGYLGMLGGGEYEESLEKSIQQAAGLGFSSNSVIYNWEKWFTDTLAEKYVEGYSELFNKELSKQNILKAAIANSDQPIYDAKTGLFKEQFLYDSYFNTTGEVISFLESLDDAEAKDILSTITKGSLGDGNSNSNLQSILNNVDSRVQEYAGRVNGDLSLDLSLEGEPDIKLAVEAEFARDFIQDYLKPRFDYSRSMDEFVEYMDVRQEEQNPFQTQNILDALKLTAQMRSEGIINQANNVDRAFTSSFYMNPISFIQQKRETLDPARKSQYENQAKVVENDWNRARQAKNLIERGQNPGSLDLIDPNNPSLGKWSEQEYRYGFDINNQNHFARLHFETKGNRKEYNFDGAQDNYTIGQIREKIYQDIFPELLTEAEGMSGVFGEFITPEEFAYEALKGVEMFTDSEFEELLDSFGIKDFTGDLDELRALIQDSIRGGAALDIREGIKYLNEKRKKPTQEKLGITYIQRESDYETGEYPGDTQLYKMFQSAGYAGTEDQFYEDFFPDVDRKEQALLTQAGKGESFGLDMPDLSDPYAALTTISDLFPDDEDETDILKEVDQKPKTSYFQVGLDTDLLKKYKMDEDPLSDLTSFLNF
jgi:hypothetical protein